MSTQPSPSDFSALTRDKLRYRDTDRQGHVNNAVFSTFFETGRVEMLYDFDQPLTPAGTAFVVARLAIDYVAEVVWPGEVEIGTSVRSIGRSSIRLDQALFQNGKLAAKAETVIVLMDESTRRSTALPETALERLRPYVMEKDASA
ncbi:acyl-CoA thioesterase [Jiella marina]|uniref:acyl-CoA thioesterase n=1 Tax=Jiella sp. LLJ827 TaxID=2917712 RepID=UPI002100EAA1|nr:thioesterase family protein [Jiella sp. LLJ827]MCQ0988521.1 acyl-CoA thioesterase [Jiella sp. LLJ827]